MGEKFLAIIVGTFLVTMAIGMGYAEHNKGQCRVEALKAGKSAEDIAKICK